MAPEAAKMKTCIGCGVTHAATQEFFHVCARNTDGLRGACKPCQRRKNQVYSRRHNALVTKALHRKENKGNYAAWNKAYRRNHKELCRKRLKKWRRENPEKNRAHQLLGRAVKNGHVMTLPCEACGKPEAHGHHEDYSKPLDVIWLCHQHHKDAHAAILARGQE